MADVQKLADAAEVIVQGYAFIDRGEGVTVINLHKPDHAAYFYNNELVETNMDDIEYTSFIKETINRIFKKHTVVW